MKLAILHYHLNRGGVSRVIQSQLEALESQFAGGDEMLVLLLYGGRREGWPEDWAQRFRSLRVILEAAPLADYDNVHKNTSLKAADLLYGQLLEALRRHGCRPEETVLHVHNHSLGKNGAWPAVLLRLAEAGYPILLQIHDFAEDFRPGNYRAILQHRPGRPGWTSQQCLYPQAEHLHYAVLNRRDKQLLEHAGLPSERLHLTPNPVVGLGELPTAEAAKRRLQKIFEIPRRDRYLLYPVRAIRRKNLGEAVLCGLLAGPSCWLGVTLAPLNPGEKRWYEGWKRWTAQHRLGCVWETGEKSRLSLADNLAAADALLSTSIAEGFGMVFLESWLVGRMLVGRNLPEITRDFCCLGLRLPGMWHRLAVPLDWLGAERVRKRILESYQQVLTAYQRPMQPDWTEALDEKLADGSVDFGDLDEAFQQEILEKILLEKSGFRRRRRQLLEENPLLGSALWGRQEEQEALIGQNGQVVREHFSPICLGRQLCQIYQTLFQARRSGPLEPLAHPERILEGFLDLRRFRMLRT